MTTVETPALTRSSPLSRRNTGLLGFLVVLVLVTLRAVSERAMMAEFGSDPQMAIWLVFMVVQLSLWFLGGGLLVGLTVLAWHHRWGWRVAGVLLLGWGLAIGLSSWNFLYATRALADARDPATSPERLQELSEFSGIQAGYELDNRLASHPHAPPELLRKLYDRHQQGTLMVLARNTRTPADILQKLAEQDAQDQWIRKNLLQNSSLSPVLRQKIAEAEASATPSAKAP